MADGDSLVQTLSGHRMTAIESLLGYRFRDPGLLEKALTHASANGSDRSQNRLEFLGDRVLGLIVSEMLLERFSFSSVGRIARRHADLVSGRTLAQVGRDLSLPEFLRASGAEAAARSSVIAGCCEAVIGALYLDGGLAAARPFVCRRWAPLIGEAEPRSPKTDLQEWCQARGLPLPEYVLVDRSGPPHEPVFTIELAVEGRPPVRAVGPARRAAERRAAEKALDQIGAEA